MFTFKRVKKQSGLAGIAENERHEIKLRKNIIGEISSPMWHEREETGYRIGLKTISSSEKSGFKWVRFKNRWETVEEAKDWLNSNFDEITKKYPPYEEMV
jgi:hypothetical protein